MLAELVVYIITLYYACVENWAMMVRVLRIKFRSPKLEKQLREASGHLAIKLNDSKHFDEDDLCRLVEYTHNVFSVKFLTVISSRKLSFYFDDTALDDCKVPYSLFTNFESVSPNSSALVCVNLVNSDAEGLFLEKLKQISDHANFESEAVESLYSRTIKSFTGKSGFFEPYSFFRFSIH
jgi:hypothetical protein